MGELEAATTEMREQTARAGADLNSGRARIQAAEREVAQMRAEVQTLEARSLTLASSETAAQKRYEEDRHRSSEDLESERRRSQKDKRGLERRLQNLQNKAYQDDQKAMQLVQAQEALRRKLQSEMALEKESLEMQLERLANENRSIKERSRSL